jgi:hypothetical protein
VSSILDLPDTGALVSRLDDVGVHCTGWYRLSPTVEITRLPLWDSRHQLFARAGHGPIDAWLRGRDWRLPTALEMVELHGASLFIPPFTLPTSTMTRDAGILKPFQPDGRDTPEMSRYRGRHSRSHRWCAMHDREVFERLTRAGWDGRQPVANAGKQWVAPAGTIFGWRQANGAFIQGASRAHAAEAGFTDYATLVFAARDVSLIPDVGPGAAEPPEPPEPVGPGASREAIAAWQRGLLAYGGEPARLIRESGGADGIWGKGTQAATDAWRRDQMPTTPPRPPGPGPEPPVVTCAEWAAISRPVQPTAPAVGIVLHHMALGSDSRPAPQRKRGTMRTPGATYEAELAEAKRMCRNIQASHRARGWVDTGQHWSVSRGGIILEGRTGSLDAARRGLVVAGAHAGSAANRDHWGIEVEGDYTTGSFYGDATPEVPAAQWDALVSLVRWLLATGQLSVDAIRGHREVPGNATGCPGTLLDRLPELRAAVRSG